MSEQFLDIGVVVLNYNGWKDTTHCLDSLIQLSPSPRWIVVVDNASSNDSVARISAWFEDNVEKGASVIAKKSLALSDNFDPARVCLVLNDENRGYAAGNNVGLKLLLNQGARACWVLNNDTIVMRNTLGELWKRFTESSRPGLCGAMIRYFDEPEVVQCLGGGAFSPVTGLSRLAGKGMSVHEARRLAAEEVERGLDFVYGASVLVSRAFIETVGFMDERYFLYCEEQDWALAARGRFELLYAPGAELLHREGRSSMWSGKRFSVKGMFRIVRSRILLAQKFHPWFIPTVLMSFVFAFFRLGYRRFASGKSN